MSRRVLVLVLGVALFGVAGLGLAACGGDDKGDAKKILDETFSGGKSVKSGKLNFALDLDAKGGSNSGQLGVKLNGPFQSVGEGKLPKFDLNVSISARGQTFTAGAISTGTAGYVKFQNQVYDLGPQLFGQFQQAFERTQAQRKGKKGSTLASLGIDPQDWVKDPKVDDDEEVGGVETTKVSGEIDVSKFVDGLNTAVQNAGKLGVPNSGNRIPRQITDEQKQQVEEAIKTASFEVYSGKDDKILRKFVIKLEINVPESRRAAAKGLESATVNLTVELDDVNKPQTITAPVGAKPISELLQQLGGLGALGGLGGSSGGTTGPSGSTGTTGPDSSGGTTGDTGGTPATPGGEKLDAYSKCIQSAGGDIRKAQECAKLLTP